MIEYNNLTLTQTIASVISGATVRHAILYPSGYNLKNFYLDDDLSEYEGQIREFLEQYLSCYYYAATSKNHHKVAIFCVEISKGTKRFDSIAFEDAIIKLPKLQQNGTPINFLLHIFPHLFDKVGNFEYIEQHIIDSEKLKNLKFVIHV